MKLVEFSLKNGNQFFGKIDGDEFFIGKRVKFNGQKGLENITGTPSQKYNRQQYQAEYGFWADFIHPTAMAEGGYYHTLNTYDIAAFTFTFLQFSARDPNGDFVTWFRALLKLPQAVEYFPDLELDKNGRIVKITKNGTVPLETPDSTAALMAYLNPSSGEVEDSEVIQAARFIHWSQHDDAHRQLQVKTGIQHFKERLRRYAKWYGLDKKPDVICLMIADIHHQGRASTAEVRMALESKDPLKSLLKLGEVKYAERIKTLKKEIESLTATGVFGSKVYDSAKGDFI